MTSFVVDCSVTASWVLPDEVSEAATQLLQRADVEDFFVPFLWPSEMANVLLMAERRNRISSDQRDRAFSTLNRLPISVTSFDRTAQWPITYALAQRFDLTFYDACYVRLAKELGAPLATFDVKMRKAAGAYGIAVV